MWTPSCTVRNRHVVVARAHKHVLMAYACTWHAHAHARAHVLHRRVAGKWDKLYTSSLIQDIMGWLLDEDAVPTEWDVLERIRAQHRDA